MERCPLCTRDTPCTTAKGHAHDKMAQPHIVYRCLECLIIWPPNKSHLWHRVRTATECYWATA
jgi:hypothetical protein